MIAATAAGPSSALDPTLQVLLTIFGGAVVAAVAGLLGAWIQARREHSRWIRERRYEAFTQAIVLLRQAAGLMAELKALRADGAAQGASLSAVAANAKELSASWPEASAPLAILGPDGVDNALGVAAKALGGDDPDEIRTAERALIVAVRESLKVRD